jgi:ABC-type sulfate transport system permease subunit
MATGKFKKKNRGSDDVNSRGAVHNIVVPMANDTSKDERDVPWSLLIAVIVLCFVLVLTIPVMGVMYMDMNNATNAALQEVKKMRELRAKILMEMQER